MVLLYALIKLLNLLVDLVPIKFLIKSIFSIFVSLPSISIYKAIQNQSDFALKTQKSIDGVFYKIEQVKSRFKYGLLAKDIMHYLQFPTRCI